MDLDEARRLGLDHGEQTDDVIERAGGRAVLDEMGPGGG
jgi:hypothetical protein